MWSYKHLGNNFENGWKNNTYAPWLHMLIAIIIMEYYMEVHQNLKN